MSDIYAELAAASYERHESPEHIGDFTVNRAYGQANSSVYASPSTVALCIRGTNPKNPQDLASDAALAVGKLRHTTRYKEIRSRFRQILRDYPNHRVIVVGHSLGGTLAAELLNEYPSEISDIYIFNPGAGIDSILKGTKGHILAALGIKRYKAIKRKTHIYRVKGDIISLLSRILPGDHVEGKLKDDQNAHSIYNWAGPPKKDPEPAPEPAPEPTREEEPPRGEIKPNFQGGKLRKRNFHMVPIYHNMSHGKLVQLLRSLGYNNVTGMSKYELIKQLTSMYIGTQKEKRLTKMYRN